MSLNTTQAPYAKPTAHTTLGWKTESFSLQKTRQECLFLLLLLNIALGVQARAIWQKKEMKSSKLEEKSKVICLQMTRSYMEKTLETTPLS